MSKHPDDFAHAPRYTATAVVVTVLVAAAWGLLWHWPQQTAQDLGLGPDALPEQRRQVQELQNARVATGAQLFLGMGLMAGVYLTYRRIRATEHQADVAQRQEITSRFTQAIEHLGDDTSTSIRLGGIYALEKIAQDEPGAYFSQFREVLCAFVRETTLESCVDEQRELAPLPTDLQATLTVLGRNPPPDVVDDPARIACSGAQLERAVLPGAHLGDANLSGAHLGSANLRQAHLERVDLHGAHLEDVNLYKAHLEGTDLRAARYNHRTDFPTDFTPRENMRYVEDAEAGSDS